MKRATWVALGAGAMLAAGLLAWAFAPRPLPVETALADRAVFEASIEEEGRTRVRERHTLTAPLGGRLQRITLREGDAVRAGDVLAGIEPAAVALLDARARREQQARVEAAGALLAQAKARVQRADVGVAQARNAQQRTTQLLAQGFVSPAQAEVDRLALLAAQRERDAAAQGERVAAHELAQARVALDSGRPDTPAPAVYLLRAPVDGRILRVHRDSAGAVAAGAPLLELADTERLEVVTELLTADTARVAPGLLAWVEAEGQPPVAGHVRRVEPAAFTKVSALGVEEQRVNVIVDWPVPSALPVLPAPSPSSGPSAQPAPRSPEPAPWGDGWRVTVRIVTRHVDDALVVPVSAVFPWVGADADDAGSSKAVAVGAGAGAAATPVRMGVFIVEAGRARLRPVAVGDRNARHAWIVDGLARGTRVIVYPGADLADGLRVRDRAGQGEGW